MIRGLILSLVALYLSCLITQAQTGLGIGTDAPDAQSILDIQSNNRGILIPRMTTVQRDAIGQGATDVGLLIYNSTTNEFNYWNGSAWIGFPLSSSDWIDGGTYLTPADGINEAVSIGTTSTNGKLNINNGTINTALDIDFSTGSIGVNVIDMNATIPQGGSGIYNAINGSPSNFVNFPIFGITTDLSGISALSASNVMGLRNLLTGSGPANTYGVYNFYNGSQTSDFYGTYNTASSGTQTGSFYGLYNQATTSSLSRFYGVYSAANYTGDSDKIGIYTYLSGDGAAIKTGVSNIIAGNSIGDKIGTYNDFQSSNADARIYGTYNNINNSSTSMKIGTYTNFNVNNVGPSDGVSNAFNNADGYTKRGLVNLFYPSTEGQQLGVDNVFSATGATSQTGILNSFLPTTTGTIYGMYNGISSTSTSNKFGSYSEFTTGTSVGNNYGHYVILSNTGNGTKMGYYVTINSSGTGNKYGYYASTSTVANNWAAYLIGRSYISYRLGIGTNNPVYQLQLSSNSAAKPTSSAWIIASDKRLKKDINPFLDGLDLVKKINPVWFTYDGKAGLPEDTGVGTIAQELQNIAPYMISDWEYADTLTNETKSYLAIDYGPLNFILVNAIKEQQKIIEEKELHILRIEETLETVLKRLEALEKQ